MATSKKSGRGRTKKPVTTAKPPAKKRNAKPMAMSFAPQPISTEPTVGLVSTTPVSNEPPISTAPTAAPTGPTVGITQPRLPKPKPKAKPVVALALSGGASHGDFEVGVVKYLYAERGVVPKIICGTSVGSINALKLAEGEPKNGVAKPDKNLHLQGIAGLEAIWRSLRVNDDMYTTIDPLAKLEANAHSDLGGLIKGSVVGGVLGSSFLGPLGAIIGGESTAGIKAIEDFFDLKAEVLKLFKTVRSLGNLDPLIKTMEKSSSFKASYVKKSKIILRLVMTALEDGKLRMVNEHGHLLERDGTLTPGTAPYTAGGKALQEKISTLEQQIAADQANAMNPKLHTQKPPFTDINRLRAQLNALLAELPKHMVAPPHPVEVSLIEAALASSSLPVFFPPQGLADGRYYVDGGTRMVTPIEPAWHAGATEIYAVVATADASTPGSDPITKTTVRSYAPGKANILDIAIRVGADIEPGEINDDQLYPPNGWPVAVIVFRPKVDIHQSLTVDPGLIEIRIDQGWMVADDIMQAYDAKPSDYLNVAALNDDARNTTEIATYRHAIWKEEFAANGYKYIEDGTGAPQKPKYLGKPVKGAIEKVRAMKSILKSYVEARIAAGGKVPGNYQRWWTDWERHSWLVFGPLYPLLTMTVHATPNKNVPLGKPVKLTVTAKDKHGKAVPGANVLSNGAPVGPANKSIYATFVATKTTETKPNHQQFTAYIPPLLSVAAPGYVTTQVQITFAAAKP